MITAKILLDMGFSGKRVGELLKSLKNASPEAVEHFLATGELTNDKRSVRMLSGSVWEWLCRNPCVSSLLNASNSEKRRWCENGAVLINNCPVGPDDELPTITSLVFFPSSRMRITML